MGWWVLGAGAVLAYLVIRARRVRRFDRELGRVITLHPDETGVYRYLADYHQQALKWRRAHLEPAAVAGLTAYEAFYALSLIDPDVLRAADRIGEDLSNWERVVEWQRSIAGMDPVAREGAFRQLVGYTGEMKVAAHLAAEGHVVEFPDVPNQPGYDLLVDGSPLQVKTTADPDLVREHLAANPDIPVVVPQELAGLDGEPGVMVDPDLSHAGVADSVDRTLDGVGALDGVAAHVPWITLAVSSFREIVLLAKGWTDLATALRNVGLDVVGVGLGGAAGARLGASLGFGLAGPVGAAVGTVLGALAGAVLGKLAANHFRMRPVKEAYARFQHALYEAARAYVDALAAHADALRRRRQAVRASSRPWLLRVLWPARQDLARAYVDRRIRADEEGSRLLHRQLSERLETAQDRARASVEVLMHFHRRPVYSSRLAGALRSLQEARERLTVELRKLGRAVP